MTWSTPPTFTAGHQLPAADLQKLSDDLALVGGARTSYVPTWTQSTSNPSLGNGTLVGEYRKVDKEVDFFIQLTLGSTTIVGSGTFTFALPAAPRRTGWFAVGAAIDTSAGTLPWVVFGEPSATALVMRALPTSAAGDQFRVLNQSQPFTWANNDVLTIQGRYEAT